MKGKPPQRPRPQPQPPARRSQEAEFHAHLQTHAHQVRVIRRFAMQGQSQTSTEALRGTTVDREPYYAFPPEADVQAGDVVTRKELLDTRWRVRRVEDIQENGRIVFKRAYLDMMPTQA